MKRAALTAGMLALFLAACGGEEGGGDAPASAPEQAAASVEIKTFIFNPDPIEVAAGDTVTFVNRDATTHTVTAGTRRAPDKGSFDASLMQDDTFEQSFEKPGEYDYFCDLHAGGGMVGKVIVG